jgi:type IV pilus assembly protein PilP
VIPALVVLSMLAIGCQRQTTGATVSEYQERRTSVLKRHHRERGLAQRGLDAELEDPTSGFAAVGEGFSYDPTGKRDPFRSFILDRLNELEDGVKGPLEQFDLSQLDVVGIVWHADRRRALIEDPSGRGYVVQEGTAVGKNDGHVMRIDDNLVMVREVYVDYVGEKTTKDIPMRVRPKGHGG